MKVINVSETETFSPDNHYNIVARKFHIDEKVSVGRVAMAANGSVDLAEHESAHVFYVLKGVVRMFDGKDYLYANEGDSIIVEPYEPHAVMGNGEVDCEYLVISSPPD